jgi:hypothetical protein
MRNMNCRNVRYEIEEAAVGDLLGSDVNDHLSSCVACKTFFREQTRLQELVASLGSVEAPGDFDFRLRARLAGEKRGVAQPLALGNFSFGLRSAAVATILLLIGSALMFVSFRTRSNTPLTADVPKTAPLPAPDKQGTGQSKPTDLRETGTSEVASGPLKNERNPVEANLGSSDHRVPKRRVLNGELATLGAKNRQKSRDLSGTQAAVLKASDQVIDTYPTTAFPINASSQSLKVSVDDGRGSSRTISLPTVSFGSQRSLSQSASPLMASARGAW